MQLRQSTDFALRVLILVGLTGDELTTIREIARRYGVSENHLMKVVHRLSTEGWVETVRGKNGGLRLAKGAESVGLGEIVRLFEGDLDLVECFDRANNTCPIEPSCALKGILRESLGAFLGVLDSYTLADLLGPRTRLRRQLDITS